MEKLVAFWSVLNELVSLHCLDKIVGMQERQAHMVQQGLHQGSPLLHIAVDPPHHRLKHHLFLTDGQLVTANVVLQLFSVQVEELLVLGHFREVNEGITAAATGELLQGMGVCKALDPQAVARVQLVLQELCAGVAQRVDLEQAGGLKEELDVFCGDLSSSGINVGEEGVHGFGQDTVDLNQHLAALAVIIAEHGPEVGGAGREDGAVAREFASLYADHNIGEQATIAELVEDLQDAL